MPIRLTQAVIIAVLVFAVAALGQAATFPNLAPWYASLHKPPFNPPNWLFGPVWSTLYVLMAYGAWRISGLPRETPGVRLALAAWAVQLVLNGAWSWLFFAGHSPFLGLVDIVPQFLAIIATIGLFARLDRPAAACIVPLACWVAFAGLLNVSIWQLNR
jgi:tryptophan-rich sensory protein